MDILHTLPTDTFVTAALAELLEDVTNLLRDADGREETAFWRRQLTALNKAQYHWLNGVRPQLTGDAYLMPSATSRGLNVYRLTRLGGILHCDCKAGQNGILCYHHMLINVVERAAELEALATAREDVSGGSEPTPDVASPPIPHREEAAAWLALQTRLDATAQYVAALRAAQRASDPPFEDNPLGDDEGDTPPARRLGLRLVQARKKSAYFASAFYLAA
jgi:hypothetical protein